MIMLYWNVRGFGNLDTRIALKNFYASHKFVFIFLAEPMITFSHVPSWYCGHSVVGEVWLPSLPAEVHHEFFVDRCGFPRIRFP